MSLKRNFEILASYNAWMNDQLFEVASGLSSENLSADSGVFFKSILGTLNHILVGDIIWLKRFAKHNEKFSSLSCIGEMSDPASLAEIVHSDFRELRSARTKIDIALINFCKELTEHMLSAPITYTNSIGISSTKNFGNVVQHLFNHQTHHRGQVTALLSQKNLNVESTDLIMKIPNE